MDDTGLEQVEAPTVASVLRAELKSWLGKTMQSSEDSGMASAFYGAGKVHVTLSKTMDSIQAMKGCGAEP